MLLMMGAGREKASRRSRAQEGRGGRGGGDADGGSTVHCSHFVSKNACANLVI